MRHGVPLLLLLAACESTPPTPAAGPRGPVPGATAHAFPAPKRIVALGDVHGDMDATRRALKLGGAMINIG